MPPHVRTRLDPADRRAMLLAAGAELFGSQGFEAVHIEEVARLADCSRALLYHYFPNKRALFVAVVRDCADQLGQITAPDSSRPPLDRLRDGLVNYFQWAHDNSLRYQAVYRSATTDDEVRVIMQEARLRQQQRILAGMPPQVSERPQVRLLVRSWGSFVTQVCLDWLDDEDDLAPETLAATCLDMLVSSIAAAIKHTEPAA